MYRCVYMCIYIHFYIHIHLYTFISVLYQLEGLQSTHTEGTGNRPSGHIQDVEQLKPGFRVWLGLELRA